MRELHDGNQRVYRSTLYYMYIWHYVTKVSKTVCTGR